MGNNHSSNLLDSYNEIMRLLQEAVDQFSKPPRGPSVLGLDSPDQLDALPPEPPDVTLASLVHHPCVVLVLGHRGGGKSALACRLQELKRDIAASYAVGMPAKAARLLPQWYGLADDFADVPPNAIIYVPESYRLFHARGSQTTQGRAIGDLVNLSRHRRHSFIFDVQNPAHLDRNIISEADIVLVKEPGPLTKGFERPQLRPIMDAARAAFAGVGSYRRRRVVWVVAPNEGVSGQLMENLLPTFWTDGLSRIFGDALPQMAHNATGSNQPTTAAVRRGRRTSSESRRQKAKRLRALGHSYNEIAKMVGVGKSQAYRLVNS